MIIFHEGLPGSGKSYAAMKDHIIPALQKGRPVVAYIEGLNFDQIAEVAGIDLEKCQQLLRSITRAEVFLLPSMCLKDALVVVDELQNFWPAGRNSLPDEVTQFITEHRHAGLDILAMGQCLNDCHTMWRRRVARKYHFIQKDVLGRPDKYKCIIYKGVPGGARGEVKFEEVTSEDHSYDSKYFGTYASHVDGAENKDTLMDARAVIWNNKIFRRWLPLFAIIFLLALGYLAHFFRGGFVSDPPPKSKPQAPAPAAVPAQNPSPSPSPRPAPTQPKSFDFVGPDLIRSLTDKAQPRLVGIIASKTMIDGRVEWIDDKGVIVRSLTFSDINALGYTVLVSSSGTLAFLRRGDYIVTATLKTFVGLVK